MGVEFKNVNQVRWMMMFDLFGWKYELVNKKIYLIIDKRKIEVIIDSFNWNENDNSPPDEYSEFYFGEKLLLGNGPKLKHKNHYLGWHCNNSLYEPVYAAKFSFPGKVDKAIGLYSDNCVKRDILTGYTGRPEHFSLWPAITYINSIAIPRGLKVGDRAAEKIGLRTLIDKV